MLDEIIITIILKSIMNCLKRLTMFISKTTVFLRRSKGSNFHSLQTRMYKDERNTNLYTIMQYTKFINICPYVFTRIFTL